VLDGVHMSVVLLDHVNGVHDDIHDLVDASRPGVAKKTHRTPSCVLAIYGPSVPLLLTNERSATPWGCELAACHRSHDAPRGRT
jgi:hypothetical protein